jgi:hypothetical protein
MLNDLNATVLVVPVKPLLKRYLPAPFIRLIPIAIKRRVERKLALPARTVFTPEKRNNNHIGAAGKIANPLVDRLVLDELVFAL